MSVDVQARVRARQRYRRIAVSSLTSFVTRGIGIAVSLATVPLLIDQLGKTDYGFWAVITSITAWMFLFDFGIINGLVNAVSEANGKDDPALARRYVSSAFSLLLAITAMLGLLFTVALPLIDWAKLLGVSGAEDISNITLCVAAAFAPVILGFPFSIARQVWAGYQRGYVANIFAAVGSLLSLVFILIGVWADASLPLFIFLSSAGPLLASVIATAYLFLVDMPHLRPRFEFGDRASIHRLTAVSLPLFLIQLGALFVNSTQMLILSHRAGLDVAAEYSVLLRLYMGPFSLVALAITPFVPTFREAAERGDHHWVQRSFAIMLGLRVGMALLVGVIFVIFGNAILDLWLGKNAFSFDMGVWIALAILIIAANHVTAFSDLLTIMDRLWWQVVLVILNGATTFALTYVLAPEWKTLGAVVASAAFTTAVLSWIVPILSMPVLRGPAWAKGEPRPTRAESLN